MNHTDFTQESTAPQWRDAIRVTAGRACDALGTPFHSRIHKACDIVLRGGVEAKGDGSYEVAGDSGRSYDVIKAECGCPDYAKAPSSADGQPLCKHVLATMIWKRAVRQVQMGIDRHGAKAQANLPEAPLSVNMRGTLRGRPGAQLTVRATNVQELARLLDEAAQLFDAGEAPVAPKNGHRPVAELTDEPCDQCDQMLWRHTDERGRSWLSHRAADGTWHKPSRGR